VINQPNPEIFKTLTHLQDSDRNLSAAGRKKERKKREAVWRLLSWTAGERKKDSWAAARVIKHP